MHQLVCPGLDLRTYTEQDNLEGIDMQHNSFVDSLTSTQKAVFFTRMCQLVDQAVLGISMHGRPLSVHELIDELSGVESRGVCVGLAPNLGASELPISVPREYIMFGDIDGIASMRAPAFGPAMLRNSALTRELTELLKLPETLTLKAVSQGTGWRKKLREYGYSVTFKPDGFGKVLVTLERYGRTLTLVQGNTVPHANAIGPDACLDLFMVQDLRNAGALIEKRS
jgi:hypothetical protein